MVVKNLKGMGLVIAILLALSIMFAAIVELRAIRVELSSIDWQLDNIRKELTNTGLKGLNPLK